MQIIFNEIFTEHLSTVVFPDETNVIPGQDTSISELLDRFTRGQRLNVKMRPQNPLVQDFDVYDEHGNQVGVKYGDDDEIKQPIIDDPDDLDDYLQEQREMLGKMRSRSKDVKSPGEKSPGEKSPGEKSPGEKSPGEKSE